MAGALRYYGIMYEGKRKVKLVRQWPRSLTSSDWSEFHLRLNDDESTTCTSTTLYLSSPPHFSTPTFLSTCSKVLTMAERALSSLYKFAAVAGAGAFVAQQAMYDVKGGTRAVIFDRLSGVKEDIINEGTHFLIPILQRPIIFDVRTKPRNISTTTGSKDLQMVSLTLRVLHRPEVRMLPKIYQVCLSIPSTQLQPWGSSMLEAETLTNTTPPSPSAPTTTNASSPPSAMKSSKPSSRNSTPPN